MRRLRERDDASEVPDGRWLRRARRHAAERRRMPKHGKTYVALVERMLARRAKASATAASDHEARPAAKAPPARRAKA
jgi:hypothetical protein